MPETKPAEVVPETPPAAPAPDPEKERLTADAAEARRMAAIAEQRAAYAQGVAAAATNRREAPPQVDILDRYSKEDLTLSPEDKRAMLDRAMRERARQEQQVSEYRSEQRLQAALAAQESKFALDLVTSQRPELADPSNAPKFAAAITKVKMEAEARGQNLSSSQLAQAAGVAYDQMFKPPTAPRPPFTEGANRDMQGLTQEQQDAFKRQPQSEIEKMYGQKSGTVRPPYNINDPEDMQKLNLEYVRAKNEPLFKKGIMTNMNEVLMTREQ